MRTIYIDVLLGINLFMNYFLLLAVSKFLLLDGKRLRILLSAFVGALYSLTILLPEFSPIIALLLKLFISMLLVRIAWSFHDWISFFKAVAVFYLMNFAFAGGMLAIWYLGISPSLTIRNSVVYFSVSPILFLFFTVIIYLIIRLLQRFTGKGAIEQEKCLVTVFHRGKSISCAACVDTGNHLREPFSGYPVIVIEKGILQPIIEETETFRLIPFRAVHTTGLLKAFRPEKIHIQQGKKSLEQKNVYVALSEASLSQGEFKAIVTAELMY